MQHIPRKTVLDDRKLKPQRAGGPDTVLANLFKKMVVELGITPSQWDHLIRKYLTDPSNGVQQTPRDISVHRGNLQKELFKNRMSWKFFYRAMRVLDAKRFEVTITFHHRSGVKSVHSEMVELANHSTDQEDLHDNRPHDAS